MAAFPLWDLLVLLSYGPPGSAVLGWLTAAIAGEIADRGGPPRIR